MKFSLASLFLSSTIVGSTAALRCGIKGVTKPCIGDTDQRYDVDKGYDLVDQDPFWGRYGGLYVAEDFHYDSDGNPFTSRVIPDLEAVGGYSMFPVRRFTNVTVDGSRHSLNSYFFLQNNAGVAPGFVVTDTTHYTSTFEKNGEAKLLGTFDSISGGGAFAVTEDVSTVSPISDQSIYFFLESNQTFGVYRSAVLCFDDDCTDSTTFQESYMNVNGTLVLDSFTRSTNRKITESEWLAEMDSTYTEFGIMTADTAVPGFNVSTFLQPDLTAECAVPLSCPTEEDWATQDPKLLTSPYVEPDGSPEAGFIIGVSLASLFILATGFYLFYKHRMQKQELRLKQVFATSIAKNIAGGKNKDLSPAELGNLYNKIDEDGNGTISKDELKLLIEDGDVVKLSSKDYNFLFSAIDIDGNGTVDFAEFCAFFASLPAQNESFNDDKLEA